MVLCSCVSIESMLLIASYFFVFVWRYCVFIVVLVGVLLCTHEIVITFSVHFYDLNCGKTVPVAFFCRAVMFF
jgi:hypothetical protein